MAEYVIMLICELLCPITMLLLGLFIWRFPAEYKSMFGYHTAAAERSPEAWAAAQGYFGVRLMIAQIPVILIMVVAWVVTCIVMKLSEEMIAAVSTVLIIIPIASVFIAIGMTEGMLKKYFSGKN